MTTTAVRTSRTRTAVLKEYKDRLGGLPEAKFFGSILWYTVAGTTQRGAGGKRQSVPVRVHQDMLREWFDDLGIDEVYLPPEIKKIDAFRNASSSVTLEYEIPGHEGEQYATLSVKEIKSDTEQVIRHVIRVVRDQKREQLSMDHMATIKFIRGGRTSKGKRHAGDHVRFQILTRVKGVERQHTETLINEFLERYEDLSSHLHAPALRGVVRAILTSYNAVSMKASAGLYFVHKQYWPQLDRLVKLLELMGEGCNIEDVALVDTPAKRESVREALEDEVEEDCNKLLAEIAQINQASRGGKIPGKRYAEVNATYNEVAARMEEYAGLLALQQGRAANALELAMTAVMEMAQRIEPAKQARA